MKIAIAWYDEAQWELLRAFAEDRDALDDSFAEWERNALSAEAEMRARGLRPERVHVVVPNWAEWCARRGESLTSESRSRYVVELLKDAGVRGDV